MNRAGRRAKLHHIPKSVDLIAENASLRHALEHANEQLAEWRELLIDNDLIEPTPRGELQRLIEWTLDEVILQLPSGRIVGGCPASWTAEACHGLTDEEVALVVALTSEHETVGIAYAPQEAISSENDPRCETCKAQRPLAKHLDYLFNNHTVEPSPCSVPA